MRKSKNVGGQPIYVIQIGHPVTLNHFANALAQYCWNNGEQFDCGMKRSKAMEILKESLLLHGIRGETDFTLYEGASDEAVAGYENAYPLAVEWIKKNYPYLNKENNE